ncbi:MAG: nucleotidyltransferase [Planctomycetota bacterium]
MSGTYLDLLARLVKHDVHFVLIGGYACIVHGGTLTTEDIDICCDFSPENLLRLQQALDDLHPVHRMTPKRLPLSLTVENCQDLKNLYLDTDLGQLDCVSIVQGLGNFGQVEQVCETIEADGIRLNVLNRNALIQSKKAMNRPHDREAVRQLEAINKMDNK